MRCCVCLNEKDRLIFDGRCSEGFCVDCVPSLGAQCPNCRQQFAWIKNNENIDALENLVDDIVERSEAYESFQCNYCGVYSELESYSYEMYPGKSYCYNVDLCDRCFYFLSQPPERINSRVLFSTYRRSVFLEPQLIENKYYSYFKTEVIRELKRSLVFLRY